MLVHAFSGRNTQHPMFQIQVETVCYVTRFESRLGYGTVYRNVSNGPTAMDCDMAVVYTTVVTDHVIVHARWCQMQSRMIPKSVEN